MPRTQKGRDPQELLPLTSASFHILLALVDGEQHGYAIMRDVRQSTDGAVRLGPGTLYRAVQSLLGKGLIEESSRRPAADEDQRRRYYRLTALGRRVLAAETQRMALAVALARAKRVPVPHPG